MWICLYDRGINCGTIFGSVSSHFLHVSTHLRTNTTRTIFYVRCFQNIKMRFFDEYSLRIRSTLQILKQLWYTVESLRDISKQITYYVVDRFGYDRLYFVSQVNFLDGIGLSQKGTMAELPQSLK